jgi:hypothetical protein
MTKFPKDIRDILHRFVIDNRAVTKPSFIDIAFIPVSSRYSVAPAIAAWNERLV